MSFVHSVLLLTSEDAGHHIGYLTYQWGNILNRRSNNPFLMCMTFHSHISLPFSFHSSFFSHLAKMVPNGADVSDTIDSKCHGASEVLYKTQSKTVCHCRCIYEFRFASWIHAGDFQQIPRLFPFFCSKPEHRRNKRAGSFYKPAGSKKKH